MGGSEGGRRGRAARGGAAEETWELSPDGGELVVTTRLPAMGERPGMEIKRVYERAED